MTIQDSPLNNILPEPGETFVSNFSIVVRVRGEFSLLQLQQALDCVRSRHGVLIPDAGAHFPLRLLTNEGGDAWKEVVKEELLRSFPSGSGPFARFVWLRSKDHSDLIGTFHHGVCDGFSGVYVLRDTLQSLGNPQAPVSPLALPPQLFTLVPESLAADPRIKRRLRTIVMLTRLNLLLGRLRRRFASKPQPAPVKRTASTPGELPPSQRMCILTETLTASQTARLVECSKAEGTTVHAAICAAWLRAIANTTAGKGSRIRRISSPVSLRNRLAQPPGEMAGMLMSTLETRFRCKPGRDFWDEAREFHANFKRDSTEDKLFRMPLMFGAFFQAFSEAEMSEVIRSFFSGPVKHDFSITNLGRLDFPAQVGPLQIEAFHNLVNSSEHERTVNVNTFDGRLTFNLIFRESKMTLQEGEQLMTQAVRQLMDASR